MFDVLGSIVAAVVSMALGFFWYSEALFGAKWRAEMNWTDQDAEEVKQRAMAKPVVLGLITEFVVAMILSYFFYRFSVMGIKEALSVAFLAWLGFSATLQFGETLWAKHSVSLFVINTSHRLVSLLLIALVLVLF